MTNRKRRLGSKVFDLDEETWRQCRALGINDKHVTSMQRELSSLGINTTAKVAAAITLREFKKRGF